MTDQHAAKTRQPPRAFVESFANIEASKMRWVLISWNGSPYAANQRREQRTHGNQRSKSSPIPQRRESADACNARVPWDDAVRFTPNYI
jgi:hypothetical protein